MAKTLHYDFTDPQFDGTTGIDAQTGPTLTVTRASDATVMDYFNVLKTVNDNEPRFTGGRRVENLCLQSGDFDTTWQLASGSIDLTVNQTGPISDPVGGTDGWQLIDNGALSGTGSGYLRGNFAVTGGETYTWSIYAKADQLDWILMDVTGIANADAYFNLSTGAAGTIGTITTAAIESVGSGWYRCSISWTHDVTETPQFRLYLAEANENITISDDGTSSVYLYGSQLENVSGQDDPAPSAYIATTTAAVAKWHATKRRTNLLLQSNDFDTTWTNIRSTETAAAAANPIDGAVDAWAVNEDGTAANNHQIKQAAALLDNETYTFSVYVKASNRTWVWLLGYVKNSAIPNVYFNIGAGVGAKGTEAAGGTGTIEDVGNGWYRCTLTVNSLTGVNPPEFRIYPAEADGDTTFDGLSQESILVYGAQLERGSTATAYIATTTTVASSDFDTAITPTGLLVEEERTNICLQSEDFANASWIEAVNALAIVGNEAVAPDGTITADKLIDDSSTGSNLVQIYQNVVTATSTAYTMSVYMKADGLDWGYFALTNSGALAIGQYFDLTNVAVGTPAADTTDSGIEDVGNGWRRCWVTFTSDAADPTAQIRLYCADTDGDISVALDGTSSIYLWGAQLEAGDFPTSYIPTTTASVTRPLDAIYTVNADWMNPVGGGTYFIEAEAASTNLGTADVLDIRGSDGAAHRISLIAHQNGQTQAYGTTSGSGVEGFNLSSPTDVGWDTKGVSVKSVLGLDEDDVELYVGGDRVLTGDQVYTKWPASELTLMYVGSNGGSESSALHISEIRYYNERLDDSVLEDMSNGVFPSDMSFSRNLARDLARNLARDLAS